MYLIDANVLFEMLYKRQNSEECCQLMVEIEDKQIDVIMSGFAIHSLELHLINDGKIKLLENFLKYLASLDNFHIYHTLLTDELKILQVMEKTGLDFDDGIQYYVAKLFDAEGIVSFDRDFNNLDLPRIEPKDVL